MNKTPQLEDGYTKIADEIIEALAKTYMSSYESQILWVILRKTYGWSKKEDWIANSQFVEMTGIHKAHVSRTVKKLVLRNIVTQTGNKIAFQKDITAWKELPKQATPKKKLPKQDTQLPKQVQLLPKQADTINTYTIDTTTIENRAKALQDKPEVFGNTEINLIMETYKKNLGFYPTDRKPRFVANNMRVSINHFCKTWNKQHPELTFEYLLEKIFVWFMKRDQLKGETLDVVRRKMKMLLEVKAEAYRKEVTQNDHKI